MFIKNLDNKKLFILGVGPFLLVTVITAIFDIGLSVGLCFVAILSALTVLIFLLLNIRDKNIYILFFVSLFIHLSVVLFLHYSHFQPFSGGVGDYTIYNNEATGLAQNFHNGNFSLKGVYLTTYFSVLIGSIYAIVLPKMIIGVLFAAFLGALTSVFVYLIIKDLGGSNKAAFWVGLIINFYPSYTFYGSLLLRDIIIVPLAIISLFIILKLVKKFSWWKFAVLYVLMAAEIHLRIYIGYSLLITFFLSFLLIGDLKIKKKLIYCIIIIPILGFLPQISGYGYYGSNFLINYLNPKTIALYQNIYNPASPQSLSPDIVAPTQINSANSKGSSGSTNFGSSGNTEVGQDNLGQTNDIKNPVDLINSPESFTSSSIGLNSSFVVEIDSSSAGDFVLSYLKYFLYILLGPLPWHMKYARHFLALAETIPWYILLYFIIKGIIASIENKNKIAYPLIFFSMLVLIILTIFISNFGIITRIRIPAFISLMCLIPLAFIKSKNKKEEI
jgi:hypothetical protein